MSLTRRRILFATCGAVPALLLGRTAAAFEFTWGSSSDGPQRQDQPRGRQDYMPFVLKGNKAFTARQVLLLTNAGAYGGAFDGKVVVRDENKLGIVKDIPFVGELFEDRLRGRDFDSALQIGPAYSLGETLIIDIRQGEGSLQGAAKLFLETGTSKQTVSASLPSGQVIASLVCANNTWSYRVPASIFAPIDPSQPPAALAALASGIEADLVGEAYRHPQGHLLVLVRPSILTGWS